MRARVRLLRGARRARRCASAAASSVRPRHEPHRARRAPSAWPAAGARTGAATSAASIRMGSASVTRRQPGSARATSSSAARRSSCKPDGRARARARARAGRASPRRDGRAIDACEVELVVERRPVYLHRGHDLGAEEAGRSRRSRAPGRTPRPGAWPKRPQPPRPPDAHVAPGSDIARAGHEVDRHSRDYRRSARAAYGLGRGQAADVDAGDCTPSAILAGDRARRDPTSASRMRARASELRRRMISAR